MRSMKIITESIDGSQLLLDLPDEIQDIFEDEYGYCVHFPQEHTLSEKMWH